MAKKRVNRQVASLNRKLKKVISENEELKVQKERYRKRLQRINLQNTSVLSCSSVSTEETDESTSTSTDVLTPRPKTMGEIRATGIPKPIRRKLLASNILSEEMKEAARQNKKKSSVLRNIVSGRIAKRYRNVRLISKMTGFDRKSLDEGCSKSMTIPLRKRSTNLCDVFADKVDQFLCRDDNSRMLPGKKMAEDWFREEC